MSTTVKIAIYIAVLLVVDMICAVIACMPPRV